MATNGTTNGNKNSHANGHAKRFDLDLLAEFPPQNLKAEMGVLAAILKDESKFAPVSELLAAEDFFRSAHQTIFRAMELLRSTGIPIEALALADELERQGQYDDLGGDNYLAEILGSIVEPSNAATHAAIVASKAQRRRLIEAGQAMVRKGFSPAQTDDELLDDGRETLERIAAKSTRGPAEEIETVCLSDVEPEEVSWLWPGRIPLGKLTLIIGDPSMGKSFLSMALAAAVTTGAGWPDAPGEAMEPGSAVLLSAEDSLGDTIRPRLDAAGAIVAKVFSIRGVKTRGGKLSPFSIQQHLPHLDRLLSRLRDARLVVIDPVSAYLGGSDEHKNAEIRGLISPLSEIAERHRCAIVMITHMNKGNGVKALYRATGSLAFVAAARVAWLITKDPKDRNRRLMLVAKSNIKATQTGMAYRLVDGVVQWEAAPVEQTADEALAEESKKASRKGAGARGPIPAKELKAMDLIRAHLAGAPDRHGKVRAAIEAKGISTGTFYRAVKNLDVEEFTIEGQPGKWLRLPPDEQAEAADIQPQTLPFNDPKPF